MSTDWAADVKKYVPEADDEAIAGIVRYCGIALRTRDASLVSFTDSTETDRVRENFLKKKLGLGHSDQDLDAAIFSVGQRMADSNFKNRVTVYYLLAEHFGLLNAFRKVPKEDAPDTNVAAAAMLGAAAMAATPAPQPEPQPEPAPPYTPDPNRFAGTTVTEEKGGIPAWLWWVLAAIVVLLLIWWLSSCQPRTAVVTETETVAVEETVPANEGLIDFAIAPVEGAMTIPEGEGVTAELRNGAPVVKVYFNLGSSQVAPAFAPTATALKGWLDANPGRTLAVSGYNDTTGNATANAEVSKQRAQSVQAGLIAAGIPEASVALVKPADTTDTTTDSAGARRVEISVQ